MLASLVRLPQPDNATATTAICICSTRGRVELRARRALCWCPWSCCAVACRRALLHSSFAAHIFPLRVCASQWPMRPRCARAPVPLACLLTTASPACLSPSIRPSLLPPAHCCPRRPSLLGPSQHTRTQQHAQQQRVRAHATATQTSRRHTSTLHRSPI